MAGFNWTTFNAGLSGLTTALTNLGISSANMPSVFAAIGAASNPNKTEELAICSTILSNATNPAFVSVEATKLATETGEPQAAIALAMTLTQPGVNVAQTVLEIEQIIRNGG
jgi:hypothetical protein